MQISHINDLYKENVPSIEVCNRYTYWDIHFIIQVYINYRNDETGKGKTAKWVIRKKQYHPKFAIRDSTIEK